MNTDKTFDVIFGVYSREVREQALKCMAKFGFVGLDPRPDAPGTYPELVKELARIAGYRRKHFPVFNGHCDKTIFTYPTDNLLFRAWHDIGHVLLCEPFDAIGEFRVAQWQAKYLTGINKTIIMIDVVDQFKYHREHGEFVDNQREFVESKLKAIY